MFASAKERRRGVFDKYTTTKTRPEEKKWVRYGGIVRRRRRLSTRSPLCNRTTYICRSITNHDLDLYRPMVVSILPFSIMCSRDGIKARRS